MDYLFRFYSFTSLNKGEGGIPSIDGKSNDRSLASNAVITVSLAVKLPNNFAF